MPYTQLMKRRITSFEWQQMGVFAFWAASFYHDHWIGEPAPGQFDRRSQLYLRLTHHGPWWLWLLLNAAVVGLVFLGGMRGSRTLICTSLLIAVAWWTIIAAIVFTLTHSLYGTSAFVVFIISSSIRYAEVVTEKRRWQRVVVS